MPIISLVGMVHGSKSKTGRRGGKGQTWLYGMEDTIAQSQGEEGRVGCVSTRAGLSKNR